jgi:hypothetical protein
MVETGKTVEAGATETQASGATDNADPLRIRGEFQIVGEFGIVPDYQPEADLAAGVTVDAESVRARIAEATLAAGATIDATGDRARTASADLEAGAELTSEYELTVPLIRRANRGVQWNERDDVTLDAETDQ